MNLGSTGCCGVKEITGLSTHKTALEAMQKFCEMQLKGDKLYVWGAPLETLYTFYTFTAAVYSKEDRKKYIDKYPDYKHTYRLYGHDFAKFIRKNKLGKVWTTQALVNSAFHPDHSVKVWVWNPDVKALQAWWDANKPPKKEEVKAKTAPQKAVAYPDQFMGLDPAVYNHLYPNDNAQAQAVYNWADNYLGVKNDLGGNIGGGISTGTGTTGSNSVGG